MSYRSRCVLAHSSLVLAAIFYLAAAANAQQRSATGYQDPPRLKALIDEALARNPRIAAARLHWQAQTKVPIQAGTLPDPQVTLQPFSVGDPLPGSGLTTSDFAYIGFGASQAIPYPGKLGLAATIAERDAQYASQQVSEVRREVREKIRELYFELFYHAKLFAVLNLTRQELDQIERIAQSHYRVGHGLQHDVIAAQLKQTEMLKELAMHHEEEHQLNLEMKAQLGREADSADIETGEVTPSRIGLDDAQLQKLALARAPQVEMLRVAAQSGIDKLQLARKGYRPDFSVGYMYQKTGPGVRDYYMLSLGAAVPLYFWRKQTPAVQQAALELESAREQQAAGELEVSSNAESALVALRTADRIINIYREGLLPQGRSSQDSAFAAYQVGNADFQTLISSLTDLFNLQQEYYRAVADHEIAAARIEQFAEEDR
ncbi:MAG TPA: TolC family protein [Candidatus Binataceae bacterium]|jgi:cobalt-zinc-cadmium efflux system outer membrane protein|nr:TolC family protein [Candidatus Binataceae bacterium]